MIKCDFLPLKVFVKEYANAKKIDSLAQRTRLIISIVLILAIIPFAFTPLVYIFFFLFIIGVCMLLIWIIYDNFSSMAIKKQIENSPYKAKTFYVFNEDNFTMTCEAQETVFQYAAIKSIYETKSLFLLTTATNQDILIAKSTCELCDSIPFPDFIRQKTNKRIKNISFGFFKFPKFAQIICFVAAVLLIFTSAIVANESYFSEKKTIRTEEYAITVNRSYHKCENDNYELYLKNELDDTSIKVEAYSADPAVNWETEYSFAEAIVRNMHDQSDSEFKIYSDRPYVSYKRMTNNNEYYVIYGVKKSNDTFWITTFTCDYDEKDIYNDEIDEFLASVSFGDFQ